MRVIGYYKSFDRQEAITSIDLDALTHLDYAFLLPIEDGSVYFKNESNVKKVVELCHEKGIKAYVSVGGACDGNIILSNVFEKICDSEESIKRFVSNVMKVVDDFGFDGIDIDWEYPWIDYKDKFESLISLFKEKVDEKNKGLTIAIHRAIEGEWKFNRLASITDRVIEMVDWLNIMTYDDTKSENHSSIELANHSLKYWNEIRKVPKDKLLIGIPFYARPSEKPYYKIIEESDKNAFYDYWDEDSYNGIYTVKQKVLLGKEYGGIIIWAINFDADKENEYSLLNEIEYLSKNDDKKA